MRKVSALLLAFLMLLCCTGCGGDGSEKTGSGHSFAYTLVGNPDTLDPQLAENASNLDTYKEDYVSLLKYLKTYCPNARILVVGDFWENGDRDSLKEQACRECGIEYVSLEGIKGNKDCECGLGTAVFDSEGRPHIVGHEGVAAHPGDSGMAAIAGRILEAFDK